MNNALKINTVYQNLIRPLSAEELHQLEENLLRDGCLDPIITWNGYIIDGHNRYSICQKHGIRFDVKEMVFSCREEAIAWICANQLGRRNLSEETRKYLIGRQYEAEKIVHLSKSLSCENQHQQSEKHLSPSTENAPKLSKSNRFRHITAQRIADANHISWSTVGKYAAYSNAIEVIRRKAPELVSLILSGKHRISHESIVMLSKLEADKIRQSFQELAELGPQAIAFPTLQRKAALNQLHPGQKLLQDRSVKDMPPFDPDSGLKSLSLTIPSWMEVIERIRKTPMEMASMQAKAMLAEELNNLIDTASALLNTIENNANSV